MLYLHQNFKTTEEKNPKQQNKPKQNIKTNNNLK